MVRKAGISDAGRIAEIHVKSWRKAYADLIPEDFLASLDVAHRRKIWTEILSDSNTPVFLACEGVHPIGFCHVAPSRDEDADNTAEITAIYIDPGYYRKGHGKQLCDSAISYSIDHKYREITLWVLVENDRGRGFYESMGFSNDGTEKKVQRPGFDLNEIRYRMVLG